MVGSGLLIPEGPVVLADGACIVVEVGSGRITRFAADGAATVIATVPGGPNGAALGPDGGLYLCNNGGGFDCRLDGGQLAITPAPDSWVGGSLQRLDLVTGELSTLCTEIDGRPLQAPNDLVFDSAGGLWFTDHGRTTFDGRGWGALGYLPHGGGPAVRVREGLLSPNGIGLSPDGLFLYWADTLSARLWRAEIEGPGTLADYGGQPGEVIASPPGNLMLDSLAVEADGRVCIGTIGTGGITVADGLGGSELVPLDDGVVTNICFGGADMQDVWITAAGTGRVLKGRWPRPGLKLAFQQ